MNSEGPGSAIIFAYIAMVIYGLLVGIGLGWLIWG